MLIFRKKYVIIRDGDNGCPREKLKVQSNDRFGIVWTGINRPRNICFICSHLREGIAVFLVRQNLLLLLCCVVLCFVVVAVVFLHQLVYFYTCSSSIVYTKP